MLTQLVKAVVPVRARRFVKDAAQLATYATPRLDASPGALSPTAARWFDALRTQGIVKIEGDPAFTAAADYLDRTYFAHAEAQPADASVFDAVTYPWQDGRFVRDINRPHYRANGTDINIEISFADPALGAVLRNRDLAQVLCRYYRRQAYHRNQPLLQKLTVASGGTLTNGNFHVDHLHQVSLMLLVSDVAMADTHMEYCIGANRRNLLFGGVELTFDECLDRCGRYPLFHCVGPKGTAFLFDTSGYHRANYVPGTSRKILHLNFTTGHHVNASRFLDRQSALPGMAGEPAYHRRMFEYLPQ